MKFPERMAMTLPNLIKFVLNHATHDLRMDTAVDVCTKSNLSNLLPIFEGPLKRAWLHILIG
jgi:hypothetical protein